MDDYTEQKVNEALFDHRDEEEEVVEEEKPAEKPVEDEKPVEEEKPADEEKHVESEKPIEEEKVEMQERSLDDLLSELNGVRKEKWQALLHFDTTELKAAFEKEGEVRESLKKMNWWYRLCNKHNIPPSTR